MPTYLSVSLWLAVKTALLTVGSLSFRAGSAIFLHLLRHTSLFVSLRSECYRQVSGIPIYDLMPLAVAGVKRKVEGPSAKKATALNKAQADQCIPLAASDELLPRSAIFYATLGKTKAASSGVSSASEEFEQDSRSMTRSPDLCRWLDRRPEQRL